MYEVLSLLLKLESFSTKTNNHVAATYLVCS